MKNLFKKIKNYISNTAWIQPLLIVVIIFVLLFSLSPLTSAIKSGWTSITTTNNMTKITYGEYVDMVYDQANGKGEEKLIFVFSQKDCEHCPKFYKSMNSYLKTYGEGTFKIYNVNLSTKSTKKKIDGVKYTQYKDKTAGLVSLATRDVIAEDYVKQLDNRISQFYIETNSSYADLENVNSSLTEAEKGTYDYVSTPLVIWYENGIEQRICNNFESNSAITLNADGDQATALSFKSFIEDFGHGKGTATEVDWNEKFNLTYKGFNE